MNSKTILLAGILLLLGLIISGWFVGHVTINSEGNNNLSSPTSFALDTSVTTTNENGQVVTYFSSPKLIQHSAENSIFIFKPRIIFYDTTGQPKLVYADYGKSVGNESVELWGNVTVHQAATSTQGASTLETDRLIFYPQKQYAETNEPVTITQPGTIVHATGLRIDLKTGNTELMSAIKMQYDPSKQPKNKKSNAMSNPLNF